MLNMIENQANTTDHIRWPSMDMTIFVLKRQVFWVIYD